LTATELHTAWARISHTSASVFDGDLIEALNPGKPGIVHEGDEIMLVRIAETVTLSPDNFDLDLEFEVDVTDVASRLAPRER
jgi:hypothetical protein